MLVHLLQAVLHRKEQGLRQLGVLAVVRHTVDQAALFHDHLFGPCDMPDRPGKMVVLGCHRVLARARPRAGSARASPAPRPLPKTLKSPTSRSAWSYRSNRFT